MPFEKETPRKLNKNRSCDYLQESSPLLKPGAAFKTLIFEHVGRILPKPVVKNIIDVAYTLLMMATSSRGWYGRLTLWGIARAMPGTASVKARRKRLSRFLANKRFDVAVPAKHGACEKVSKYADIRVGMEPDARRVL